VTGTPESEGCPRPAVFGFTPKGRVHMYRRMMGLAVRRPGIIPALLGLAWASRRIGWYRRFPFLPIPPRSYLEWRLDTAYGEAEADPPERETLRYLNWTRRMRKGG